MNRRLIILIFLTLVLIWKFVLFPSKLDLSDRAKVLHGISLTKPYKEEIARYWQSKTRFPGKEDWQEEGLISAEMFEKSLVKTIIVGEEIPGSISVYYKSQKDPNAVVDIAGKKIVLIPSAVNGELKWQCKGTLPEELLPVPCR